MTKKPSNNLKKGTKNNSKLKIPATSTKAYKKLLKNISLFSLDSPTNGILNTKTVTSCKNNSKKGNVGKKKKGSLPTR